MSKRYTMSKRYKTYPMRTMQRDIKGKGIVKDIARKLAPIIVKEAGKAATAFAVKKVSGKGLKLAGQGKRGPGRPRKVGRPKKKKK